MVDRFGWVINKFTIFLSETASSSFKISFFMSYSLARFFVINEKGKRENNEDFVLPHKTDLAGNEKIFIVSDGVGGVNKGEVASEIVCQSIFEFSQQHFLDKKILSEADLQQAITYTKQKMAAYIQTNRQAEGMAATLTLAYIGDQQVSLAWCGDSRIYYFRNGEIIFKSRDHSLVNYLVSAGQITEEEAINHPKKNTILRCITVKDDISTAEVVNINAMQNKDIIILCTDGILEAVADKVLTDIVKGHLLKNEDPKAKINKLCSINSKDNYSMIFLELDVKAPVQKKGGKVPVVGKIVGIVILLCLVAAGWLAWSNKSGNDTKKQGREQKPTKPRDPKQTNTGTPAGSSSLKTNTEGKEQEEKGEHISTNKPTSAGADKQNPQTESRRRPSTTEQQANSRGGNVPPLRSTGAGADAKEKNN